MIKAKKCDSLENIIGNWINNLDMCSQNIYLTKTPPKLEYRIYRLTIQSKFSNKKSLAFKLGKNMNRNFTQESIQILKSTQKAIQHL